MPKLDPITKALNRAVEEGVFPGAVVMVRHRGLVVYEQAVGLAVRLPEPEPATLRTIYDLASLTKPLATASAMLCLVQDEIVDLAQRVDEVLGDLKGSPVGAATVFHLLNHSAGLPAWRPLYERIAAEDRRQPGFLGSAAARRLAVGDLAQEPLLYPIGARSLYSDLGFVLLGLIVERMAGRSLDVFCRQRIYGTLEVERLGFMAAGVEGERLASGVMLDRNLIAATEDDPWRGRILRGEVHDENAFAMGGVAGHAGLFGTASAVLAVSRPWLQGALGQETLFRADLVRRFVVRQEQTSGSSWALGWDTPASPSASGSRLSAEAFGHLGYTGTSLWVDPVRELEIVLLSNRVHPDRQNNRIQQFRPVIHDLIFEELIGE